MPTVQIETTRHEHELEILRQGMRAYTESRVPWQTYEEITVVLRDDNGTYLGAGLGEAGRGWLNVVVLWVAESHRGKGYGTQLLRKLEAESRRFGCHSAYLDTFSYQARPFYERHGYEVFGTLDDYPVGHQRHYMRKSLIEPDAGKE